MLELTRLPDWDRRLARAVDRHAAIPGEWGTADCLLTCADVVDAVTGIDPAVDIRGRYKTEAGAVRLLRKRGYADVGEALAALFPVEAVLMAQRGDLGVVEREGRLTACFITTAGAAAKTEHGLSFFPQTDLMAAFRVGR